jgi:hypothetical protein
LSFKFFLMAVHATEYSGGQHELESAAHRKALTRSIACALTARGIQDIDTHASAVDMLHPCHRRRHVIKPAWHAPEQRGQRVCCGNQKLSTSVHGAE